MKRSSSRRFVEDDLLGLNDSGIIYVKANSSQHSVHTLDQICNQSLSRSKTGNQLSAQTIEDEIVCSETQSSQNRSQPVVYSEQENSYDATFSGANISKNIFQSKEESEDEDYDKTQSHENSVKSS